MHILFWSLFVIGWASFGIVLSLTIYTIKSLNNFWSVKYHTLESQYFDLVNKSKELAEWSMILSEKVMEISGEDCSELIPEVKNKINKEELN